MSAQRPPAAAGTVLGIDIGGTGVKGAPVRTRTGRLAAERFRIRTPQPSTPEAVAATVAAVADHFDWRGGPIGCTFPAVVKDGVTLTAANVDSAWIGAPAERLLSEATRSPVTLLNDADAAGIAEMRFGAGRGERGVVIVLTLGTGIGTALFNNGRLVPGSELGHLVVDGRDAEARASERAREERGMSWEEWAGHVSSYLGELDRLLWPDLIIIGGGASKKAEKFMPHLRARARLAVAALRNEAGIVGAALHAGTVQAPARVRARRVA